MLKKLEDVAQEKFAFYAPSYNNGRYETVRPLNSGGMGYILLVKDTWSGAHAVIKGSWWSEADLRPGAEEFQDDTRTNQAVASAEKINELNSIMQSIPVVIDVFHEPVSPTRHQRTIYRSNMPGKRLSSTSSWVTRRP